MNRQIALALVFATPATAHGTLPGGGGFAAGFSHPFLAADHLLVLLGLGAMLGGHRLRAPLLGLLAGLMAGFGLTLLSLGGMQPAILTLTLVIGVALAAAIPLGPAALMVLAAATGLMVGADTDGAAAFIALAGVTAAVFLIVLNAMALGHLGTRWLNGVPLRVAGSWIAAAAILVLAILGRGGLGLT